MPRPVCPGGPSECHGRVWSRSIRPVAGECGNTERGCRIAIARRNRNGISYASADAVSAGSITGWIVTFASVWTRYRRSCSTVIGPSGDRTTP